MKTNFASLGKLGGGKVDFELYQYIELCQVGKHLFLFVGMLKIFNFAIVSTL